MTETMLKKKFLLTDYILNVEGDRLKTVAPTLKLHRTTFLSESIVPLITILVFQTKTDRLMVPRSF